VSSLPSLLPGSGLAEIRTREYTDIHTKSRMPLITVATHRLRVTSSTALSAAAAAAAAVSYVVLMLREDSCERVGVCGSSARLSRQDVHHRRRAAVPRRHTHRQRTARHAASRSAALARPASVLITHPISSELNSVRCPLLETKSYRVDPVRFDQLR